MGSFLMKWSSDCRWNLQPRKAKQKDSLMFNSFADSLIPQLARQTYFFSPPPKWVFSLAERYAVHVRHLWQQTKSPPQSSDVQLRLQLTLLLLDKLCYRQRQQLSAVESCSAFPQKEDYFWVSQRRDHGWICPTEFIPPFKTRKQTFPFHVFIHNEIIHVFFLSEENMRLNPVWDQQVHINIQKSTW